MDDIGKYISEKYLSRIDKEIKTSHERVRLFDDMNDDPVLVDYLDSKYYKCNHVKNKNDSLSESDQVSRALESIGTYILHPDFKEYNIRSKEQLRDIGRFKCKRTGKYKKFNRKVYLEQLANSVNLNSHYDDYMTAEELAAKIIYLSDTSNLWDVFDFSDRKHVKQLLHAYHMIIPEIEGKPDTRAWSLIVVLNELINKSKFSPVDRDIILLLQSGNYSYHKIKKKINKKYNSNYNYETIKKKIGLLIPRKISKAYQKIIKNIKK